MIGCEGKNYVFNLTCILVILFDNLKFERILTKGSKTNAEDGIENIKKYVEFANRNNLKIKIMPGGGVTKYNYMKFVEYANCTEVHGTKIV